MRQIELAGRALLVEEIPNCTRGEWIENLALLVRLDGQVIWHHRQAGGKHLFWALLEFAGIWGLVGFKGAFAFARFFLIEELLPESARESREIRIAGMPVAQVVKENQTARIQQFEGHLREYCARLTREREEAIAAEARRLAEEERKRVLAERARLDAQLAERRRIEAEAAARRDERRVAREVRLCEIMAQPLVQFWNRLTNESFRGVPVAEREVALLPTGTFAVLLDSDGNPCDAVRVEKTSGGKMFLRRFGFPVSFDAPAAVQATGEESHRIDIPWVYVVNGHGPVRIPCLSQNLSANRAVLSALEGLTVAVDSPVRGEYPTFLVKEGQLVPQGRLRQANAEEKAAARRSV